MQERYNGDYTNSSGKHLKNSKTSRDSYNKKESDTRFSTSSFFHESVSPGPLSIPLGPFRIFSKIRGDIREWMLSAVSTTPAIRELIHEKNLKSKISRQTPFNLDYPLLSKYLNSISWPSPFNCSFYKKSFFLSRFFGVHTVTGLSDTWSLGIRQLSTADQGKYECQARTSHLTSH